MRNTAAPVLLVAALTACGSQSPEESMIPQATGETLVYECGEYEFVVRTGPGEVALYLPDDYRVLGQVRSGSGSKYTDTEITYWSKGDSASLDLGARRYVDCALNRERGPWEEARRRGVHFRAVGQEPGWQLEIQQDRNLLLVVDYGSRKVLIPTPEPELSDGLERYRAEEAGIMIDIETATCFDTMSGARYTHRVRVSLEGREYRGCGLSLEPR
jgi:putative lipoprotein